MQQTIVITGASGRLGQACSQAFSDAHWRVLAHSLSGPSADNTPLPQQADVLLHAANPPYTQWHTQALLALEKSIALSLQLGAVLMLPGNVYNYQPVPALLTEALPQHSSTRKGQLRIAMETLLRRASEQQGLQVVVLRAGDFFGSGTGSWFDLALASKLRKGQLVYPGPVDIPHAWAYLPDLAQTLLLLAQQRDQLAAYESLHFPGHTLSGTDWLHALEPMARSQGWLKPGQALQLKSMPWTLMSWLAPLVPMWREVLEMRYLWDQPHALHSARLPQLLGTVPSTPLPLALQASLQQLGLSTS